MILSAKFCHLPPLELAWSLLGKIIRHRVEGVWLAARIIETEAYDIQERGSHASLGFTEKRRALFMPPGTLYMYYARGGDSLNISATGRGNGVLIKSGYPVFSASIADEGAEQLMQQLNPLPGGRLRPQERLCSGQTLLCRSLGLKVVEWDQKQWKRGTLELMDTRYQPQAVIQATRLGIPTGRNEELPYRLIDERYARYCTSNPLAKRGWQEDREYWRHADWNTVLNPSLG